MKTNKFAAIITIITIIMNLMMIYIIRNGDEDVFSNWVVIIIVTIAFIIHRYATSINQQRQTRPEFYGILLMSALSLIRLLNRLTNVPFAINSIAVIVFVGAGAFFIGVAVYRINSNRRR